MHAWHDPIAEQCHALVLDAYSLDVFYAHVKGVDSHAYVLDIVDMPVGVELLLGNLNLLCQLEIAFYGQLAVGRPADIPLLRRGCEQAA